MRKLNVSDCFISCLYCDKKKFWWFFLIFHCLKIKSVISLSDVQDKFSKVTKSVKYNLYDRLISAMVLYTNIDKF